MIVLYIFLILLFLFIVFCFVVRVKYINFIKENSKSIEKIEELNRIYTFYNLESYDYKYTYDNEKFYNDISPEDYLIYQLQFISSQVLQVINYAKFNKNKYYEYLNAINSINCIGQYKKNTKIFNIRLLNYLEYELINKLKKNHQVDYYIEVKLFLSDINGKVYDNKYDIFDSDYVLYLIKRLNNKNGKFYNDKGIWNALCRVERGKVSNKMRFFIYKRDEYRCKYCHRSDNQVSLEIDHIIPIAKGGKSTYDNLQTLCHECNVRKGNQ